MASATLTLIGMYNWDSDLFHDLILPDGIDKDLFVNSLLLKAGEFEVLYANPDFMKQAIGVWGSKWFRTFSEWLRGTQATWNPIHNYDRHEEITIQNYKQYAETDSPNFTVTTQQTVNSTTEHDVSAFDQTGYTPSSKDTTNNGTHKNNTIGKTSDVSGNSNYTDTHTGHIYGNIGVTQSSEMLRSFYDISQWNLMDHICDVFAGELLIPVY